MRHGARRDQRIGRVQVECNDMVKSAADMLTGEARPPALPARGRKGIIAQNRAQAVALVDLGRRDHKPGAIGLLFTWLKGALKA